jgi:hypothetical protein
MALEEKFHYQSQSKDILTQRDCDPREMEKAISMVDL